MPDYIYLLENRLSNDQRAALSHLREAARQAGTILFLTGDAVRDLTSGHAVHELEIAVHGNALKLKKTIENLGGKVWGEDEFTRSLYLCFPGTVRVDVVSTHRVEYPKPGKPVIHPASIHEDLRRRDFTVNAMAISLNEGSFGLLMDPLNGAADIEARTLRLVSNYGFIEEPSLLIRATRYRARLGWDLDPRTQTRYENAKGEGVIETLSAHARSQELEQIGHEEEALKVLRALEDEGWMAVLFPAWTADKADVEKLKALHDLGVELLMQGVHPDMSAAQMQLLTAGLSSKDLAALKKSMLRPGFVEEWNSLDTLAAGFSKALLAKQNAVPSASYKLFTSYDPEAILWLGFTGKSAAVVDRFHEFLKVWPEARQKIPYLLMQEMRITPELPKYMEVVQSVFLELIDGKLTTPEEMRAFLEPHSPPAPPPQVSIKRTRARRGAEAKLKEHFDEEEEEEEGDEELGSDEELDEMGSDEGELSLGPGLPKGDLDLGLAEEPEAGEEAEEEEVEDEEPAPPPPARKSAAVGAGAKAAPAKIGRPVGTETAVGKQTPADKGTVEMGAHLAEPVPERKAKVQPAPEAHAKPEPPPAKTKPAPTSAKPNLPPAAKKISAHAADGGKAAKPPAKSPAAVRNQATHPATHLAKHPSKPALKAAPQKGKPAHAASAKPKTSHPAKTSAKKSHSQPAKKR